MKKILLVTFGLSLIVGLQATAQNQAPVLQQSTSTTQKRGHDQTKRKMQKEALKKQRALQDTPLIQKRQLRPDSLRRGGAIKVDTIR